MKPDTAPDAQRAAVMRAVKSSGTAPELAVRAAFRQQGLGYRLGGWGLPGKPDVVMTGRRLAIFVHGCFWHGHPCPCGARAPKTNAAYWQAKIARNQARDRAATEGLPALGWRAVVIWECEVKDQAALTQGLAVALAAGSGVKAGCRCRKTPPKYPPQS
jgi:DNA mismatch endonuclease, patch repair protein